MKRKILFLGEVYRADAQTWMRGLEIYGDFEFVTWELGHGGYSFKDRTQRMFEYLFCLPKIQRIIREERPDMVIAERTTSYGFLAALSQVKPCAIAQQGRTDLWPENSIFYPLKKAIQSYAFKKADLIHAWGTVMTHSMKVAGVDMDKVLVLPKGIDTDRFYFTRFPEAEPKLKCIVTRSLLPEYRHDLVLKAFGILKQGNIDFQLTIIGDGAQKEQLETLARELNISEEVGFTGRIPNTALPKLLSEHPIYISMPETEGVSASLFEAMAAGCFPVVSNIPGNQSFITDLENGLLVSASPQKLADSLLWIGENKYKIVEATQKNREFVVQNANYHVNMKIIAARYHKLIDQKQHVWNNRNI